MTVRADNTAGNGPLLQRAGFARTFDAAGQDSAVSYWEGAGLCCFCGHSLAAHRDDGCDHEVRDYGETDCGCVRYRPLAEHRP